MIRKSYFLNFIQKGDIVTINTFPLKMRQRGQLTIPQSVRDEWSTHEGDMMTLVQFGEFAILAPTPLKTPALAKQFSQIMDEEKISLVDLLEGLAEERKMSSKEQTNTNTSA